MEFCWRCTWTRTIRTRPMTEYLSLMELSCPLVLTYLSTLGRRNQVRSRLRRQSMWPWSRVFRKTIFMRYLSSFIFPARDVRYHTVKEVNRGAIHLAKILVTTSNSKHINIRHRFLRDVWSALHHADFFTKPFQNGGVSFLTQLCDEFLAISSYLF